MIINQKKWLGSYTAEVNSNKALDYANVNHVPNQHAKVIVYVLNYLLYQAAQNHYARVNVSVSVLRIYVVVLVANQHVSVLVAVFTKQFQQYSVRCLR